MIKSPNSSWIFQIEHKHNWDPKLKFIIHAHFLSIFKSKHIYILYTMRSTVLWSWISKKRWRNFDLHEMEVAEIAFSSSLKLQISSTALALKLCAKRINSNQLDLAQFQTSIAMSLYLDCSNLAWIAQINGWILLNEVPGTRICKEIWE